MTESTNQTVADKVNQLIPIVMDFPKPGIGFRDTISLLSSREGLSLAINALVQPYRDKAIDLIVGAESRGFIFGTAMAHELQCGFVPARKPGKLPRKTIAQEYELEYGTDRLEIHADAIRPGQRVLMVDDLLATGGTMQACCQMVEKLGGNIVGICFLVELAFLSGRQKLSGYDIFSLLRHEQE
jgi:adenine phosphoribosyltransferase